MAMNVTFQAREPDRRCYLTYDKLIVDDNVYIFNDLEGRVERLPNKVRSGEIKKIGEIQRERSSAFILVCINMICHGMENFEDCQKTH